MESVSRILADHETQRARHIVFVILSVLLHGGLVAGGFIAGRINTSRPAQLPAVSVRIVRPEPRPQRQPQNNRSQQQTPRPTARPQPTQAPQPTPAPVVATPAPEPETHSATAMAAPNATPQPTAPTTESISGAAGRGLSLQGKPSGGGPPAIPSDFQFTYYVDRMLALIESHWYKPPVPSGTRARVRFTVLKTGRVEGIQLEESSGVSTFDRAALRALYATNPLPPLPPAYSKSSLTIHLTFAE
ncbi:MAG: TonB family protein [bacterium]|nr:TonB family protein [bacterium]